VSAAATDIPYGRASSAGGLESSEIFRALVEGAPKVIPEGRKVVVMHQKSVEAGPIVREAGDGLRIEQELEIYIHRNLTRTITVMSRKGARA
jgi:tRNA G10  N-methylase Trm11